MPAHKHGRCKRNRRPRGEAGTSTPATLLTFLITMTGILFRPIYTVSEQTTNNKEWQKEHFKTDKTPKEITICLQTRESRD